jgi:hypothetical protein
MSTYLIKILHLRVENAISDLIIIDGLDADFSVAGFARQIRASSHSR